jgi:hypothetical protein
LTGGCGEEGHQDSQTHRRHRQNAGTHRPLRASREPRSSAVRGCRCQAQPRQSRYTVAGLP